MTLGQGQFFYNDFVSKILFNAKDDIADQGQKECEEKVKDVAIVDIKMTQADALVFEKTTGGHANTLVIHIGGLFSLYIGASFLSFVEIVCGVVRKMYA